MLTIALAWAPASARPGSASSAGPSVRPSLRSGAAGKLAVLPLEIEGSDSERVRQTFGARRLDGLRRGPYRVVAVEPPETCVVPTCDQEVAASASADLVVRTRVVVRDNVYRIVFEARDAQGRLVMQMHDGCEICGLAEAGDLLSHRAAALVSGLDVLAAQGPTVSVEARPRRADVFVDGRFVGRAPLSYQLSPGPHVVAVAKDGHVTQTREVTAVAGLDRDLSFRLGRSGRGQLQRERALTIAGATTLGLGTAVLLAGVPLLVLDGRPHPGDCDPDAAGNCRHLYQTLEVGASLTAIGTASVITGAALLAVGLSKRRDRASVRAGVSSVEVRF